MRLTSEFYSRPATELAPELLGKLICRNIVGEVRKFRIVETECYFGMEDSACHASKGLTPRTKVMFGAGGAAYIYLCYGIHYLLNIVTGSEGHPEAVLIRGVESASGPGRVTALLQIDKSLSAEPLCTSERLWLEDDGTPVPTYTTLPRVGIAYAAPFDRDRLWRYLANPVKN